MLVVVTSRPEDADEEGVGMLKKLAKIPGVQRIVLGALEEGVLRKHIAALLEVETISEQLLRLIENRTGGNLLCVRASGAVFSYNAH